MTASALSLAPGYGPASRETSASVSASAGSEDAARASSEIVRNLILALVHNVFHVSLSDLRAPRRCRAKVALARQVGMYLAHVALGLTLTETGRLFGRDRTTVAHACASVEDRRDDPDFDLALEHLEQALRGLWHFSREDGWGRL